MSLAPPPPHGMLAGSPGLGARGPKAPQELLLVLQVLPHLLAHVENGAVPAAGGGGGGCRGRLRTGQGPVPSLGEGWGLFPGLWPPPAAQPTRPLPQRAVCSAGTGGADNGGCLARCRATAGRISPVTWRGNPPRLPVPWGKPGPALGRGPGWLGVSGGQPFPGQHWVPGPAPQHPPPLGGWDGPIFQARTLRLRRAHSWKGMGWEDAQERPWSQRLGQQSTGLGTGKGRGSPGWDTAHTWCR